MECEERRELEDILNGMGREERIGGHIKRDVKRGENWRTY